MTDKVILVFARLDYSHSGPEEGSGGCGTTSLLTGIATDLKKALAMINAEKNKTLSEEGLNPIIYDLEDREVDHGNEVYKGLGITIRGVSDGASWTNDVTWYTQEVPLNELLEHFEL